MIERYESLLLELGKVDRLLGGTTLLSTARHAIQHLSGHYSDLNEQSIIECRKLLGEHLGIKAAFFDDCVALAVKRCLDAEEELRKLKGEPEEDAPSPPPADAL